ncbi:hypothetical protein QA600_19665 [Natronococcus sp. A-GB1]|uniref:hypothetical protein n=1 Tax=Natronococcus sp. A-GB1 TaxID=3037648 RepID=UPI00241D6559|nr:hypothetical protein [Natronococcus sp. A-GB1]MDG5761552.1 hypothetical protein [Natronococcus sp. A-GB1]
MTSRTIIDPRLLLIWGFLALGVGTILAYLNPATGYEPSIYSATPFLFWICVSISLFISTLIVFTGYQRQQKFLGLVLGGSTMVTIVALPIIRGYYWVGESDALGHLGHTRDLQQGAISLNDLIYPAIHTLGSTISNITGINVSHSLLLIIVVFVAVYLLYIPCILRELTSSSLMVYIGVFSGFFLLPLNFLGVHMQIHPTSQAIMFSPVILYLFSASYIRQDARHFVLLFITFSMFIMIHPQQAANYVLMFGGIAAVQLFLNSNTQNPTHSKRGSIYYISILAFLLFWIWTGGLQSAVGRQIGALVTSLFVTDTDTGTQVSSRGMSLDVLGGSMEEVFLKIFFAGFLFCLFGGLVMLAVFGKTLSRRYSKELCGTFTASNQDKQRVLLYLTAGFVIISGMMIFYLIGDRGSRYFRHYGFMMVIVTIFGAIFIGRLLQNLEMRFSSKQVSALTVTIMLVFLVLTVPVVHPSPYIYQTSGHVTESQVSGYEHSFEYWSDGTDYADLRSTLSRYDAAINGERSYSGDVGDQQEIPDHFADQSLQGIWQQPTYITVTEADRTRDADVYNGFRYRYKDFDYLDSEPEINKVHSGDGLDLYLMSPS